MRVLGLINLHVIASVLLLLLSLFEELPVTASMVGGLAVLEEVVSAGVVVVWIPRSVMSIVVVVIWEVLSNLIVVEVVIISDFISLLSISFVLGGLPILLSLGLLLLAVRFPLLLPVLFTLSFAVPLVRSCWITGLPR